MEWKTSLNASMVNLFFVFVGHIINMLRESNFLKES